MTTLIPKYQLTGTTTNRAINLKFAESVSVLDFGADATGSSDSTSAIQAAITSCLSTGAKLYFPAGTYSYTSSSTFLIDTLTAGKSLTIYGDGKKDSVINLNANNKIFTVNSGENGSGPTFEFNIKGLTFNVTNPSTNTSATIFYVARTNNDWGAHYYAEDCYFGGFTNTAIWGIRCFNSGAKECHFVGLSAYSHSSGLLTTYQDACVRMWGADGSTTVQNHSFSNLAVFKQCMFRNTQLGLDAWNMTGTLDTCTFSNCWVGVLSRVNPSLGAVSGLTSSTEKGGYGISNVISNACWYEENALYAYSNVDINLTTGATVNPSIYLYLTVQTQNNNFINNNATTITGFNSGFNISGTVTGTIVTSIGPNATASTASGTWVTAFSTVSSSTFLVTFYVYNFPSAGYVGTAIIFNTAYDSILLNKSVGTNIDIQLSGNNVQLKQTAGTSQPITYSAIRIS